MMRRSLLLLAVAFVTFLVVPVSAHFAMSKSSPAKDQALTASPKRLELWFSEVPAAGVSQIKLAKADKTDVAVGKTLIDEKAKSMYVELATPLAVGAYVLAWRGAGDDGHVVSGEIKFSIAAPKTTD
jgi:methionine-rich copper-binding protein CopC